MYATNLLDYSGFAKTQVWQTQSMNVHNNEVKT